MKKNNNIHSLELQIKVTDVDYDISDICQLKQDMGTCYNYQIKWFYDVSISRCRRFYYGSCGGNGNRFETREECVQMCVERKVKPKLGVVEKGSQMLNYLHEPARSVHKAAQS